MHIIAKPIYFSLRVRSKFKILIIDIVDTHNKMVKKSGKKAWFKIQGLDKY